MNYDLSTFEGHIGHYAAAIFAGMDPDYRAELQTLVDLDPALVGMSLEPHPMGGFNLWWAGRPIGWIAPFPDPAKVA